MATTKVNALTDIGNIADADKLVGERVDGTTVRITFNGVLLDSEFGSNGLMTRTAAGTYASRTLTGTSNVIDVTDGDGVSGNPTIDISSSYVGQTSITTLGTIATGTWQGTAIDSSYIADAFLLNTGDVGTGVYDFGGATSFEIPNSASPTVDAAGEIAIDTTITDHTGLITYHDGTEALYVVGMPTGNLSTADGYVVAYDATNNEFEMVAQSGGGGGSESTEHDVNQTSHGFSVGDVVRISGATTYTEAQADSATNAEVAGVVSAVAGANDFTLTTAGYITGLSGLTANTLYYLDPSSAGAVTSTEPTTTGQISKPIYYAESTTTAVLLTQRGIEVGTAVGAASQAEQETATEDSKYVAPATQQYHPSACKGWCQADTAGNATTSYNVTSVTDVGVGQATIVWDTDLSSANGCHMATSYTAGAVHTIRVSGIAAGSTTVVNVTTAPAVADPDNYMVAIFGDQ